MVDPLAPVTRASKGPGRSPWTPEGDFDPLGLHQTGRVPVGGQDLVALDLRDWRVHATALAVASAGFPAPATASVADQATSARDMFNPTIPH